jgi:hypothetical protein
MSDGDRGKRSQDLIAAGLAAVALFGAVVLAFAIGGTLGVNSGRDQVSAREHYEHTKQDNLRACIGREGAAAVECVSEAIEAAQDQSDARQDLYAQQDMSKWAFWMVIVSGLTVGITAVGVWFVKRTLDATLEAVADTGKATAAMIRQNEIAEKAQRPWLDFDIRILRGYDFGPSVFSIKVSLQNHSGFPAHDVRVAGHGNYHGLELPGPFTAENHRPQVESILEHAAKGGACFPQRPFESTTVCQMEDLGGYLEKIKGPAGPPGRLLVGIRYQFDGGVGFTFKAYRLFCLQPFIDATKGAMRVDEYGELPTPVSELDPTSVIAI